MSEYSFGNIIWVSIATLAAGDDGVELQRKLREAKKAAYDGYAAQMRDMSMADKLLGHELVWVSVVRSRFRVGRTRLGHVTWGRTEECGCYY